MPVCFLISEMQKRVWTSGAERLPKWGNCSERFHDGASAYTSFFITANGGINGPVSTRVENEFSQMGPALLVNSAGDTVGAGVTIDVRIDVAVSVGDRVSLGRLVGLVVEVGNGAA